MLKKIKETSTFIQAAIGLKAETGIILGTGLGGLVNEIEIIQTLPYQNIPNFPVSTVEGHKGELIFGKLGGKNIIAMQGRFHFYEGYDMQQVTFPIRVMKMLGIEKLILSNVLREKKSVLSLSCILSAGALKMNGLIVLLTCSYLQLVPFEKKNVSQ